jgi:hypothetical protein
LLKSVKRIEKIDQLSAMGVAEVIIDRPYLAMLHFKTPPRKRRVAGDF